MLDKLFGEATASALALPSMLRDMNLWAVKAVDQVYWGGGIDFNKAFRLTARFELRWGLPPYRRVWFLDFGDRSMAWRELGNGRFERAPELVKRG